MQDLLLEQKKEIERAVATAGEYRVASQYSELAVTSQKWFKMTEQQRFQKIQKFMKANIDVNVTQIPMETAGREENPLVKAGLPPHMHTIVWARAQELVSEESALVQCPGDPLAWMVKSSSGQRPHYVKPSKSGGYICDDLCISYKSAKICSHVVAVALKCERVDELIHWYKTLKTKPNFTVVAESGKPSSAGKKSTGRRKASTKKATQHVREVLASADESSFRSRAQVTPTVIHAHHAASSMQPTLPFSASPPTLVHNVAVNGGKNAAIAICSNLSSHSRQSVVMHSPPYLLPVAGNVCPTQPGFVPMGSMRTPPPLMPIVQTPVIVPTAVRPPVDSPFWIAFVRGNISRCNGCKGRIARSADNKPLPPPGDIVLRHREHVVYHNSRTGMFEQSRDDRNVYYHAHRTCVAPHFLDFNAAHHIKVDASILDELSEVHLSHLEEEFSVRFL